MTKKKETKLTASQIIRRRHYHVVVRDGYRRLIFRAIAFFLIGYLLLSQVFMFSRTRGNAMYPAVRDGDLIFAYRLQKDYVQDDVVIYTVNGKNHVGRIVAGGSDVVTMDDSGTLLVNGTDQGSEIMYPTYAKEGIEYPYRVPDGYVFILGDYRTKSEDSRDFGPVPLKDVRGKALSLLRRRGL